MCLPFFPPWPFSRFVFNTRARACVGNLLDRRYGNSIDRADVVIRINDAPTASGYQMDIGRGYPDRVHGLVRSGWGTGLHNAVTPSCPPR